MNVPNTITGARIILIPVFMGVFYLPFPWANNAAALLFALVAATDWLDGYLARRLQQTSAFGAFLDPVADKLAVAAALVLMVQTDPHAWVAVPAAVIIGREITISALREWMAEIGKRMHVAVASIGKVKTVVQMVAIIFVLYRDPLLFLPIYEIGLVLLYLAVVLTLWSMLVYLKAAWPAMQH